MAVRIINGVAFCGPNDYHPAERGLMGLTLKQLTDRLETACNNGADEMSVKRIYLAMRMRRRTHPQERQWA